MNADDDFCLIHGFGHMRLARLGDLVARCMECEREAKEPSCKRCGDTGWLDPIEGADGSYITSRPCSCGAYRGLP